MSFHRTSSLPPRAPLFPPPFPVTGTLSFIFNTYRSGTSFSQVVADAKAHGYTEPDPREDLSGSFRRGRQGRNGGKGGRGEGEGAE